MNQEQEVGPPYRSEFGRGGAIFLIILAMTVLCICAIAVTYTAYRISLEIHETAQVIASEVKSTAVEAKLALRKINEAHVVYTVPAPGTAPAEKNRNGILTSIGTTDEVESPRESKSATFTTSSYRPTKPEEPFTKQPLLPSDPPLKFGFGNN